MFDQVRGNKKFVQIVLAMIILPFALWGVDSYVRSSGTGDNVAMVGGTPITSGQFQQALAEQQERLRPQLKGGANPELLDSPEMRRAVLEELINQRLLALYSSKSNLRVSNEALVGYISSVPSLQEDGKFSRERYEALVAAQGMSIETFEAKLKQDLVMQQAVMAAGSAAVAGRMPAERWLAAQLEEREISEVVMRAEQFAGGAKLDAEAVKKFYEENRVRFEKPEQVRVEFLVLSKDKLTDAAKVGEEEIKSWYQANQSRLKAPEQRRASHILITAAKNAPATEIAAAKAKAEQILAQLKANPGDFAKLAKQHSQDPGSADKGGDLGFFGRGMMVKPFEDAVFTLKADQLSDVVQSDFGFHLIKLTEIRAESARPLEEMRGEISAELKRQAGAKAFAEAAEGFANMVYEQPDSLKPAAEKYGLSVQVTDWLSRSGQAVAPFTNPKLLQALFSDDAVKNRRNTEAIDVGNNVLVSARVVEHQPAAVEPLETVAGVIETVLVRQAAAAKAVVAGEEKLGKLTKGEKVDVNWSAPRVVSRMHAPNLSPEARSAVFAASVKSLPAYVGAKMPGGYALYRISKAMPYDPAVGEGAAARGQALRQQYGEVVAQEELIGWLAALKQRYEVKVNNAALERK
jgi:peptidyl-prolyl cis-trans isomerase D